MGDRIYLSPPDIGAEEREAVLAALESGWVTTLGPAVDAFEQEMSEFVGVPHAVALSSGTAALHLALLGAGVGPGDEVLVSTLTFAATANAVIYCGASPVFIDSERDTWNMDPALLEEELQRLSRRAALPAAVVVVDVFGQCANYDALAEICAVYGVPMIEDAAESLGASWGGRAAGSFGQSAVLSFNGNKIMTTSGGGMLLTHDAALADRARHLATQAREPAVHYEHRDVGFNYRLSNLLAGLGSAQLRRLPSMIERRREIRAEYRAALAHLPEVRFQPEPAASSSNAWLTAIEWTAGPSVQSVVDKLATVAIEVRPIWRPMHLQPVFSTRRSVLSGVSDEIFKRGLCLPSGSRMRPDDVQRVAEAVAACFHE